MNLDTPETIDFGKVYVTVTKQCEVTRTMQRFTEISTQASENELVQCLSQWQVENKGKVILTSAPIAAATKGDINNLTEQFKALALPLCVNSVYQNTSNNV